MSGAVGDSDQEIWSEFYKKPNQVTQTSSPSELSVEQMAVSLQQFQNRSNLPLQTIHQRNAQKKGYAEISPDARKATIKMLEQKLPELKGAERQRLISNLNSLKSTQSIYETRQLIEYETKQLDLLFRKGELSLDKKKYFEEHFRQFENSEGLLIDLTRKLNQLEETSTDSFSPPLTRDELQMNIDFLSDCVNACSGLDEGKENITTAITDRSYALSTIHTAFTLLKNYFLENDLDDQKLTPEIINDFNAYCEKQLKKQYHFTEELFKPLLDKIPSEWGDIIALTIADYSKDIQTLQQCKEKDAAKYSHSFIQPKKTFEKALDDRNQNILSTLENPSLFEDYLEHLLSPKNINSYVKASHSRMDVERLITPNGDALTIYR